jgi:hypothetical protein
MQTKQNPFQISIKKTYLLIRKHFNTQNKAKPNSHIQPNQQINQQKRTKELTCAGILAPTLKMKWRKSPEIAPANTVRGL